MPFIVRDKKDRPKLVNAAQISKMTMPELETYEKFLWECMEKLPHSPVLADTMNAIYREVEWRAQDTEFGS
jgi:hypothetical protein